MATTGSNGLVSNWIIESPDVTGNTGGCPSLALDAAGFPHIAYGDSNALRHAYKAGSTWVLENVIAIPGGACGELAFNRTGEPAIAFSDGLSLYYASHDAGVWKTERVEPRAGQSVEGLVINGTDVPGIVYYDRTWYDVKFAYRTPSGWQIETVESQGEVGGPLGAKLGPDGLVHIIYADGTRTSLKYARRTSGGWAITEWDPGPYPVGSPDLAFDSQGRPWFAYTEFLFGGAKWLKLGRPTGNTWEPSSTPMRGEGVVVSLDARDWPRLAYCQEGGGSIRYARWQGSEWSSELVSDVACSLDFVLDRDIPHLAYYWEVQQDLRYATVGLDAQPPESRVLPLSPFWTNRSRVVSASALDAQGYLVSVSLWSRSSLDGASWGPWRTYGTLAAPPWSWTFWFPDGPGFYEFYTTAGDGAGNVEPPPAVADAASGFDPAPPVSSALPVLPYWHADPFAVVNGTAADGLSGVADTTLSYAYSRDNATWGPWRTYRTVAAPPWSWTFWFPDGPGHYRFHTIARDLAGNVEGSKAAAEAVTGYWQPADYAPVNPRPSSPVTTGLSLPVTLSVETANLGFDANGTSTLAFANASTPSAPFALLTVPPIPMGTVSGPFAVTWTAPAFPCRCAVTVVADYYNGLAESDESNNAHTWTIDVVAGPVTSLVLGQPNVTGAASYVTSSTALSFSVLDQGGTGIRRTMYRVDSGPWIDYTASGPFALLGGGERVVEWFSEDRAGNVETVRRSALRVDDTPPVTALSIGDPKQLVTGTFVTSLTPLALQATEGGAFPVGVAGTHYRIDGGQWTAYASPFTLGGTDGGRTIEYRSWDVLGNVEPARSLRVVLDNTPPETTIAPVSGDFTPDTLFSVTATDAGSGVSRMEVRIDSGLWTPTAGPFALPAGPHTIRYRSVDRLGNVAAEKSRDVSISEGPPAGLETNLKPVVAALFSLLLGIVGAWSARRKALRARDGRKALLAAFALTALPFVVAEAATGLVSWSTGALSIPPLLGPGTAVDVTILAAGVAFAVLRARGTQ